MCTWTAFLTEVSRLRVSRLGCRVILAIIQLTLFLAFKVRVVTPTLLLFSIWPMCVSIFGRPVRRRVTWKPDPTLDRATRGRPIDNTAEFPN